MIRFTTHVCMVSAQATPNLAPILSEEFRPDHVILLVSTEMERQANVLEKVLKKYHVTSTQISVDAYDTGRMEEQMLDLLIQHPENTIALNVTGGTKLMAIVAQEAFRSEGKAVFYFNIETNAIQFIGQKTAPLSLKSAIKLDDYLISHGYQVQGKLVRQLDINEARKTLTQSLIKDVTLFSKAIGKLNFFASSAEEKDTRRGQEVINHCLTAEIDNNALNDPHWSRVIDLFSVAKIVQLKGNTLHFTSVDARFYANGGWLEDHVFGIVKQLEMQDAAVNMRVENHNGTGHAENELDVAFLVKNRLHLIECKARIFKDKDSKGADALYKLDSLAALGGLNTRCMLISYRELRDADRQRAKDLRIKIVEAAQLNGLKNQLQTWISAK